MNSPTKNAQMNANIYIPNMTGRPGYPTMEMNGGSSASHLDCSGNAALASPGFLLCVIGGGTEGNTRGGQGSFPLYGGPLARSYSVSNTFFCQLTRTGPTITSPKARQGRKVYKPHFSPEFGGFSLEKVAEFRLNPGSRTKFANLPDLATRWLVHS